ncbi:MAG: cytochrome P460 family protein [Acidobacteria bacterium]|nr:cytochrome P460 family protein [Acidobacteriota bacterium]MCL5289234.1 cytochrome P460 family protein [Acidobacteriota bacterium]
MKRTGVQTAGVSLLVVALAAAGTLAIAAPQEKKAAGEASSAAIALPAGYRSWTHVKSMVIHDKAHPLFGAFGGIHHVYVNAKGAAALRKGESYPDGSVFAFDLLEANERGGAYVEGNRKVLAVMVKNAKRYAATGGWGFEAFAGGDASKRVVKDAAKDCFACHASQKKTEYVYSAWRP